jgi:hypothetical protein
MAQQISPDAIGDPIGIELIPQDRAFSQVKANEVKQFLAENVKEATHRNRIALRDTIYQSLEFLRMDGHGSLASSQVKGSKTPRS